MISSDEMRQLDEMFGNQLSVLEKEKKMQITEKNNAPMGASTENADSFEDRQEYTIDKGSTETMYPCIIET
jgi:hypothetical protein